jgi:hypothetical protein
VDTRTFTAGELAAWERNIPVLLAEEALRDRRGALSPEELFHALLLTGSGRLEAEKARARRVLDDSRRSA